jgi:hypothetical protein
MGSALRVQRRAMNDQSKELAAVTFATFDLRGGVRLPECKMKNVKVEMNSAGEAAGSSRYIAARRP